MNPVTETVSPVVGLAGEQFAAAFPFHLAMAPDLRLLQVGVSLTRIATNLVPGVPLQERFTIILPEGGEISYPWIVANRSRFVLLEHRATGLRLRGGFILLTDSGTLLFLASPWVTDSSAMSDLGIGLEDFSVHDPMADLLMVLQFNKQALGDAQAIARKLAVRQGELRQANARMKMQNGVLLLLAKAQSSAEAALGVLEPICRGLEWEYGALWVREKHRLMFAGGWHKPGFPAQALIDASREISIELGVELPGRAWSSGEPEWIADIATDQNFQRAGAAAQAGLVSAVAFSIRQASGLWGVLEFFGVRSMAPDSQLVALLNMMGAQVGQTIERLEARLELEQRKNQALAMSEMKALYIATISHEIRTPLNAVVGMCSLMKDMPMDTPLRSAVSTIETSSGHLLSIINDVLDINRLDEDSMPLKIVNFDLFGMVEHVMCVARAVPAAQGLNLESHVAPALGRIVQGDQGRIVQVLTNLMANAVKFTDHGGVILRVSGESGETHSPWVRFEIQDTGCGVPISMREKIFEPFEQVDSRVQGSGLGLAISRKFARRMGGDLTLLDSGASGSTFAFRVPLQRGALLPDGEARRLRQLYSYDIIDTPPEPAFDALVAEAARVCNAPIAVISLIDENRQWFKAKVGLQVCETPREQAFCAHAILSPSQPLVVHDAQKDPRFSANPLVVGEPRMRFYAGMALVDAEGQALGTLCVIDRVPRELRPQQLAELQRLAMQVMALIHARKTRTPALRVLVAEDDPASQMVIQQILHRLGHTAKIVGDGEQAVRVFAQETFDLVFLDFQMPYMDGQQAAREIRQLAGGVKVPIVGLSAFADQEHRARALESGMTAYQVKPVRLQDIERLIAGIDAGHGAVTETAECPTDGEFLYVDMAALRELGDDLTADEMIAALGHFKDSARETLQRLRAAVGAADAEGMRNAAHRIKGLYLQFAAPAAAQLAAEVERLPPEQRAQSAKRLIAVGEEAIAAVCHAADQLLAQQAGSA